MASKVDIANIALSNLGEQPISSLSEANQRARAVNGRIDDVRDLVLRSHLWNCALLVQAMGCRLAAECAQDITGKTELKDSMMAKYLAVLSEARSADAAEGTPQKIESDLWLQSRFTSIDSWRPFSADVVQENAY